MRATAMVIVASTLRDRIVHARLRVVARAAMVPWVNDALGQRAFVLLMCLRSVARMAGSYGCPGSVCDPYVADGRRILCGEGRAFVMVVTAGSVRCCHY